MSVIEIYVVPPKTPVAACEDFPLTLEISNCTTSDLPADRLIMCKGKYNRQSMGQVPAIPSNQTVTVSVDVKVNPAVSVEDVPKIFQVSYRGTVYPVEVPVFMFTGHLRTFKPTENTSSPNFNVLLYGIAGAAKSSFLNSILTLLSPKWNIITQAASGGSVGHVTRKITRYSIKDQFGVNINFWDTWGLTPNSYQADELYYILSGALPSGWDMNDSVAKELTYLNSQEVQNTKQARKIHAVIFFISHASLSDRETVEIIKANYGYLQTHELNPILVLTKTDEVFADIRNDPLKTDSAAIRDLVQKAVSILNIPENFIYCGINYTKEKKKTFEIDRANFAILDKVLNIAYQNGIREYGFSGPSVVANPAPVYPTPAANVPRKQAESKYEL